jgi:hydroxyacylglutathione hydrolase
MKERALAGSMNRGLSFMIQVKIFYAQNDLRNFSYLLWDTTQGNCWCIDPFDEKMISHYIKSQGLNLVGIFNTHQHWDHIKGNQGLKDQFNCSVISSRVGSIDMGHGQMIQFMNTPGHTPDHLAFLWKDREVVKGLYSGDTLFNSGVGNCKNGGNVDELFETTQRLLELPEETILYPGHDYILKNLNFAKSCEPENPHIDEALLWIKGVETERGVGWTLGQEKKVNPFMRLGSSEIRQKLLPKAMALETSLEIKRELFKNLRRLRDNW